MNDNITLGLLILGMISIFFIPKYISKFKIKYLSNLFKDRYHTGCVYIVSNKAFKEDIVKIGMTSRTNYKKRLKELFNTSVPYSFDVEYILKHNDPKSLEKELHTYFNKYRLNSRREFFKIKKSILKKELKSLNLIKE